MCSWASFVFRNGNRRGNRLSPRIISHLTWDRSWGGVNTAALNCDSDRCLFTENAVLSHEDLGRGTESETTSIAGTLQKKGGGGASLVPDPGTNRIRLTYSSHSAYSMLQFHYVFPFAMKHLRKCWSWLYACTNSIGMELMLCDFLVFSNFGSGWQIFSERIW